MTYGAPPVPEEQAPEEEYADARPADDDLKWRTRELPPSAQTAQDAMLARCDASLKRALTSERPRQLLAAIFGGSCTALKSEKQCARCRICPAEGQWAAINGYYNATKSRVTICAEKELSDQQVADTLTHELVHAYDHCRHAQRVPFVGRQHPWALKCPALACSEVRAYLLGNAWKGSSGLGGYSFGGGGGGISAPGWGGIADFAPPSGFSASMSGRLDETPSGAADEHRERIYASALHSIAGYGTCQSEDGQGGRAALDQIFNACLADHAPFGQRRGGGDGTFPEMPAEASQS